MGGGVDEAFEDVGAPPARSNDCGPCSRINGRALVSLVRRLHLNSAGPRDAQAQRGCLDFCDHHRSAFEPEVADGGTRYCRHEPCGPNLQVDPTDPPRANSTHSNHAGRPTVSCASARLPPATHAEGHGRRRNLQLEFRPSCAAWALRATSSRRRRNEGLDARIRNRDDDRSAWPHRAHEVATPSRAHWRPLVDPLVGNPFSPLRKGCLPASPTPRHPSDQSGSQRGLCTPDHAQAVAGIHSEAPCRPAETACLSDVPEEKDQAVFRVPKTWRFRGPRSFTSRHGGDH